VTLTDELAELCRELVRSGRIDRIRFGLDYFDASINRVGAWALGYRSARKALLAAFLEPRAALIAADEAGEGFARLALLEEAKTLPLGAAWDEYCRRADAVPDRRFIEEVEAYGRGILSKRG
jgi:L-rhamnose isomerase